MICDLCARHADDDALLAEKTGVVYDANKNWVGPDLKEIPGHNECQGCDCQHKNVGSWNGGR